MEFTINCPVDGPITVSLEDIDTVVLRESDRADITFVCPECGAEITVSAVVPSFLLAAIEALAEESDAAGGQLSGMVEIISSDSEGGTELKVASDDPVVEAYCEYFRRQLSQVESVEDVLSEFDTGR